MKTLLTAVCTSMALAAGSAAAQDTMKKNDSMAKDSMPAMTMQQCKDYMAMSSKEGMKKDDATMKKDSMCSEMMKKDAMAKKDGMPSEPMKK